MTTSSLALLERDVLTVIVRDEPNSQSLGLLVTRLEQVAAPGTLGSILLTARTTAAPSPPSGGRRCSTRFGAGPTAARTTGWAWASRLPN